MNATYSIAGKKTNNFLISYSRNFDRNFFMTSDDLEVKLTSPDLESGLEMSRNVTQQIGDVVTTGVLVSAFGLNQNFKFAFEKTATPKKTDRKIDLKSSFNFAKHVQLDVQSKDEVCRNILLLFNNGKLRVLSAKILQEKKTGIIFLY